MGVNKPITIVASMQRVVTFVRRCRSGDAVTKHMFSEALWLQLSPDIDFPLILRYTISPAGSGSTPPTGSFQYTGAEALIQALDA